jgi:TetR/AcrR family transcriptional regulator, lmrAB and yxaGH operons repressor
VLYLLGDLMSKGEETRARLIQTTADLLTRQGYHATGLNQITQESGAFKGGKDELVVAAMHANGAVIADALTQVFSTAATLPQALEATIAFLSTQFEESKFQKGCPIATVTLEEASSNDQIQATAQEIYQGWRAQIAAFVTGLGYSPEQAAAIAFVTLSTIEGALIFSRAERSTAPLKQALITLITLLSALPQP